MRNRFYILFLIVLSGCKPKEKILETTCSKVTLEYEKLDLRKQDKNHIVTKKSKGAFTVYFVGEYKDQLKFYLDSEYRTKMKVEKDELNLNLDYAFNFGSEREKISILKIESTKSCFEIKLKKEYPIMYAWQNKNGEWKIRFSNYIHTDNLKASS